MYLFKSPGPSLLSTEELSEELELSVEEMSMTPMTIRSDLRTQTNIKDQSAMSTVSLRGSAERDGMGHNISETTARSLASGQRSLRQV